MAAFNEVILECMENLELRKRFISNPYDVFSEKQCPIESDVQITAVQSDDNHIHITLPEASCASSLETSGTHPKYKGIVIKCLKDAAFKDRFLKNPKKVLEEAFSIELGSEVEVHAHVMDAKHWVFVFPPVFSGEAPS